jgi:hypothetical protein
VLVHDSISHATTKLFRVANNLKILDEEGSDAAFLSYGNSKKLIRMV